MQNTDATGAPDASHITPHRVIDNLSDLAQSVTISEEAHHDHLRRRDVTGVYFALPGGFSLSATREDDKGHLTLLHIIVPDNNHQQNGTGVATLQRAIKYAADNDLRLFANACTTGSTPPLSRLMRRLGYVVKINPAAGQVHDGVLSLEVGTTARSFADFDE